jgi:hypothetical protein
MLTSKKSRLYDRRVMDRYRDKGLLTKDEYEKYIKNLPDDAANAQWVQMDIHDAELTEGSSVSDEEGT